MTMNKLPIGFRFHPTDEELILHYLKRKVCSLPLPATVITDLDIFHFNPWDIPGDAKEKRYFFCKRQRNVVNKCIGIGGKHCGYWKATAKQKQIMAHSSTMGIKRSYVFYGGMRKTKTPWIAHEFCLVATHFLTQKPMMQEIGEWVVCCVYQKKSSTRNHHKKALDNSRELPKSKKNRILIGIQDSDRMNMMIEGNNESGFSAAQTSYTCISGITEISSDELGQEANSYCSSAKF